MKLQLQLLQLFVAIILTINQASSVFLNKPDYEVFLKPMTEQCEKVGGNEAVKEIQNSVGELTNCVSSKFNGFLQDFLTASQTGNFKPLITKSCSNEMPAIKKCIRPVVSTAGKCLPQQNRQDLEIIIALVDEAFDYVCFNGGERIISFLATDGLQCYRSNADKILECQNSPESQSMIKNLFLNESVSFFNEKSCKLMNEVSNKCVLGLLKTCSDKTPANLYEGLYHAIEKKTPCNKQFHVRRNGADHPESSILFGTIIVWKIITLFEF